MDPFHFSCPHCLTNLRVRDPLSLGRQIDCPECGGLLQIAEECGIDGQTEFRVRGLPDLEEAGPDECRAPPARQRNAGSGLSKGPRHKQAAGSDSGTKKSSVTRAVASQSVRPQSAEGIPVHKVRRRRPRRIVVWLALGVCAMAVLACVFVIAERTRSNPPAERREFGLPDRGEIASDIAEMANPDANDENTADIAATVNAPLERLGALLLEYVEIEGAFPAGTVSAPNLPVDQRLSWQAVLANRLDDVHPSVSWDHAWNDPVNDLFVRRRLREFQNPGVAPLTGDDGYPATHFVGVAGVGADAARLPISDLRAGIFGDSRRTRLADIRDGTSNTWLALGVREQLGSWGAGGRSTVRGLSREPYVNGPDGFGTGEADAMHVLFADGSVRKVGAGTDPRLLRSMAAMADGGQFEAATIDEQELAATEARRALMADSTANDAASDDPDDQPLEPEIAPDAGRKRVDLAQSLRRPILLYDLPRARPLYEWLPEVGDMIGAPIRFDEAELGNAVAALKTPVRVRLENTTVGEILANLLKPAGLTYRIEGDTIRLAPQK